jgi:hypothetical protein
MSDSECDGYATDLPDVSDEKYDCFDDLAIGVMQRNMKALRRQRQISRQKMNASKDIEFRFNITTPYAFQDRKVKGAVNKINLRTAAETALKQMYGHENTKKTALPSTTCYLKELILEDATNTLPVDVHLECSHGGNEIGSYISSQVDGSRHVAPQNSLYCVHSGSTVHCDNGRTLHTVSEAVKEDKFSKYVQALARDVKSSVSLIKGGKAVEYLSPWAVLTEDEVTQGDWLVDVMFKNPCCFHHPVQAIRTPRAAESDFVSKRDASGSTVPAVMACTNVNEDKSTFHEDNLKFEDSEGEEPEDTYVCSFRCHKEDWDRLNDAVTTNIVTPLKSSVIDLKKNSCLHFSLTPVVNFDENSNASTAMNTTMVRSGTAAWSQPEVADDPGRCTVSLKAIIKFV